MDVASLDVDSGCSGVEILVLKLPDGASIHCVTVFRPEFLYIELRCPATDFFVRSECDLYLSVSEFRMLHHILDGIHYLRHSCLVIGSEKRGPISSDYCLPLILQQFRELAHLEAQPVIEPDVVAVVVMDYLRMYILPRCIGRCIHVGDESHRRYVLPAI